MAAQAAAAAVGQATVPAIAPSHFTQASLASHLTVECLSESTAARRNRPVRGQVAANPAARTTPIRANASFFRTRLP